MTWLRQMAANAAMADNARIIRINAGPDVYLFKEQLWDHLDSFSDNLVNWLNEQPRMLDFVHTHYADAGYVGTRLVNLLSVHLILELVTLHYP